MDTECRLFAVEADDLETISLDPAWIVGQAVLRGAGWCDLRQNWRAIDDLLPVEVLCPENGPGALFSGGPILRILSPSKVASLQRMLLRLTDSELLRRFDYAATSARAEDCPCAPHRRFDPAGWERSVACEADWTLDQAEEFESLAECLDSLREFVRQAAALGQGIVIAFCRP